MLDAERKRCLKAVSLLSKFSIPRSYFRFCRWNKAIPAIAVGIAFFFIGCKGLVPVKKEPEKEAPVRLFADAEAYRRKGELQRALEAYGLYLEAEPGGEKAAPALERMAEIYFETEQYRKGLGFLESITRKFPDYAALPHVRYLMVRGLYLLKEYRQSADEALGWLGEYHGHPVTVKILLLLAEDFRGLGDDARAFGWGLEANEALPRDDHRRVEIEDKLEETITKSGVEDLEQLAEYASGTRYAPKIYRKMATIFLKRNQLEKAKKAAIALVESTTALYWVSEGKHILARIQEETSVRKGVVGCLLPLTGPFAIYGEEIMNGILLGMGMSGEPGQGQDLELVIKDTGVTPEHALSGLEDLVQNEKIMAVIGPLSSKIAVAVAKKSQELGVPLITLTQKKGIMEEGDMVFRNFMTPSREVKSLLNRAIGEMGLKRFGILYPDNSYGRFFMSLFWDRMEEMGGTVTAVESYKPDRTDFADQIKKMTGLYYPRPRSLVRKLRDMWTPEQEESEIYPEEPQPIIDFDAVFIPDNYQRVAMIAPQLVYHDVVDVLLLGTSLWESRQLVEEAGDYIQGAIFPTGFFKTSGDQDIRSFVEDYRANFDDDPGILAATGYDTIRLVKRIMARDDIRTRKDFRKALLWARPFDGVTGRLFLSFEGDVDKEPLLLTISGRRMVPLH